MHGHGHVNQVDVHNTNVKIVAVSLGCETSLQCEAGLAFHEVVPLISLAAAYYGYFWVTVRSKITFSNVFWDFYAVVVLSTRSHDLPVPNVQISPL